MKMSRLFVFLCFWLPMAGNVKAQVTEEALQCFQWFSTLGYPDVREARWAEVWRDQHSLSGPGDTPQAHTLTGFITGETETTFTVLTLDLTQATLTKSKAGTPVHVQTAFEERPFVPMARQRLDELEHPPARGFGRHDVCLGHKAEVFFLAYACWRRGEAGLAARLYAQAEKLEHTYTGGSVATTMQEALEIDLGHAAMWDAVVRCGGTRLRWRTISFREDLEPRVSLLEAFRRIVRLFPRCAHLERAKQSVAMLERMVAEDKSHPVLAQAQIDQLPQEQRIAELVWMLRDQNGQQWMQPGTCDVLRSASRDRVPSAGHQLVAIGTPAVPALIEALTDERFSRSVGFGRSSHFSHRILTVGECAQQILRRISGQNFNRLAATAGELSVEDKRLAIQQSAQAWWEKYQQKGKRQVLVDSIAAGDVQPAPLIQQLKAEAPEAVADAVLRGADNARSEGLVRSYIAELDMLKSPAATQRLLKLMQTHPTLIVRLEAAGRLLNQEHPQALPAILHEWGVFPAADHNGLATGFQELVDLLAASGAEQAVRRLVAGWDDRPPYERLEIVEKLGDWLGDPAKEHSFTEVKARPVTPGAKAAAVELLAHALEDTDMRDGMAGSRGEFEFSSPRICDFALWALHEIDGRTYAFSPRAGRRQHDVERIAAANVWRRAHQQPLLPPPAPASPRLEEKDALKIVAVRMEPATGLADSFVARRALELRGTAFMPQTLPGMLRDFASQSMPGASGLRVEASREDDLTGVVLHLRISPGRYPQKDDQRLRTTWHGRVGREHLGCSSGESTLRSAREAGRWRAFEEEISKHLNAPPTTAFIIGASLEARM
ncbi:MAG: hypothetical protein ACO1TE_08225 [Prosthecobacter sp.]